MHGQLDPIPLDWSRLLADTIPDAGFAVIDGGSHFPMVEDPDALPSAVVPWLRKHAHAGQ